MSNRRAHRADASHLTRVGDLGRTEIVIGGLAWILSALQFFIVQVIVASAWHHPPYSWTRNYISDLGNTTCGGFAAPLGPANYVCSPHHDLMNASFIAAGLLTIAGAILLRRIWPPGALATIALVLWLLNGVGNVMIGLFPENVDQSVHLTGALGVPLSSIAMLLTGIAIRPRHPALGWTAIALCIAGIVGTFLSIVGVVDYRLYGGLGAGGIERIAVYPAFVWLMLVGVIAMVRGRVLEPTI